MKLLLTIVVLISLLASSSVMAQCSMATTVSQDALITTSFTLVFPQMDWPLDAENIVAIVPNTTGIVTVTAPSPLPQPLPVSGDLLVDFDLSAFTTLVSIVHPTMVTLAFTDIGGQPLPSVCALIFVEPPAASIVETCPTFGDCIDPVGGTCYSASCLVSTACVLPTPTWCPTPTQASSAICDVQAEPMCLINGNLGLAAPLVLYSPSGANLSSSQIAVSLNYAYTALTEYNVTLTGHLTDWTVFPQFVQITVEQPGCVNDTIVTVPSVDCNATALVVTPSTVYDTNIEFDVTGGQSFDQLVLVNTPVECPSLTITCNRIGSIWHCVGSGSCPGALSSVATLELTDGEFGCCSPKSVPITLVHTPSTYCPPFGSCIEPGVCYSPDCCVDTTTCGTPVSCPPITCTTPECTLEVTPQQIANDPLAIVELIVSSGNNLTHAVVTITNNFDGEQVINDSGDIVIQGSVAENVSPLPQNVIITVYNVTGCMPASVTVEIVNCSDTIAPTISPLLIYPGPFGLTIDLGDSPNLPTLNSASEPCVTDLICSLDQATTYSCTGYLLPTCLEPSLVWTFSGSACGNVTISTSISNAVPPFCNASSVQGECPTEASSACPTLVESNCCLPCTCLSEGACPGIEQPLTCVALPTCPFRSECNVTLDIYNQGTSPGQPITIFVDATVAQPSDSTLLLYDVTSLPAVLLMTWSIPVPSQVIIPSLPLGDYQVMVEFANATCSTVQDALHIVQSPVPPSPTPTPTPTPSPPAQPVCDYELVSTWLDTTCQSTRIQFELSNTPVNASKLYTIELLQGTSIVVSSLSDQPLPVSTTFEDYLFVTGTYSLRLTSNDGSCASILDVFYVQLPSCSPTPTPPSPTPPSPPSSGNPLCQLVITLDQHQDVCTAMPTVTLSAAFFNASAVTSQNSWTIQLVNLTSSTIIYSTIDQLPWSNVFALDGQDYVWTLTNLFTQECGVFEYRFNVSQVECQPTPPPVIVCPVCTTGTNLTGSSFSLVSPEETLPIRVNAVTGTGITSTHARIVVYNLVTLIRVVTVPFTETPFTYQIQFPSSGFYEVRVEYDFLETACQDQVYLVTVQ